jgi:Acyl-coenzyme A:6-aminopenicillanic acid acyl-transferase
VYFLVSWGQFKSEQILDKKNIQGINFIRLRGTEMERARAHGAILRDQIRNGAVPFLAKKNEMLIRRSPGVLQWKATQASVIWFYRNVLIPYLHRHNSQEVREIMKVLSIESGISYDDYVRSMLQPDAFMLLCRTSVMKYLLGDLPIGALPACTSAVTLSDWTESGRLLVCRNQDYPVVGPWEKNTTVIFHEPTEKNHIPFISITTAGIHTGGLTSMNREGLTLALHAHFGKNVSLKGTPIVEIGNAIIRQAKTLDEAIDIARKYQTYCNWAFVISSAKENNAIVLEMTPKKILVRYAKDGFLAHTNYFHSPELQSEEALISGGYVEDLHSRYVGIRRALEVNRGLLEPKHMTSALGNHLDVMTGVERVVGNTVSVVTSIKSVVFDPGSQQFWISSRNQSPTGLGEFVQIDVENFWVAPKNSLVTLRGNRPQDSRLFEGVRHYREAYREYHMESDRPGYLHRAFLELQKAAEAYPVDGNIWLQIAIVAFKLHKFKEARISLERTLGLVLSPHTSGVRDLYLARCMDIEGQRLKACELYLKGKTNSDPSLRKAMLKGLKRPYTKEKTGSIMIDLQLPDTFHY